MACNTKTNEELIKQIDIEQRFADLMFKDMRSKRFGLSPCCSIEQISKYTNKKEICDWEDKKLPVYVDIAYTDQNSEGHGKHDSDPYWYGKDVTPVPDWVLYTAQTGTSGTIEDCSQVGILGVWDDWPPFSSEISGCTYWATQPPDLNNKAFLSMYINPATVGQFPNTSGTAKLLVVVKNAAGEDKVITSQLITDTVDYTDFYGVSWTGGLLVKVPRNSEGGTSLQCPSAGYTAGKNGVTVGEVMKWYIADGDDLWSFVYDDWVSWSGTSSPMAAWPCCPIANGDKVVAAAPTTESQITLVQKCTDGENVNPAKTITFCGMTKPTLEGGKCEDPIDKTINDFECLSIYVKDSSGNPIECHPIVIDNREVGMTDKNGFFYHRFVNASIDTKHSLNSCHCFETRGACEQQRIDITVTPDVKKADCEKLTVDCTS